MTAEDGHFLSAEQLRPGVFVILDLPWFKHNFTLNCFKIRNADQVQALRELKLSRYRYDPARSDALDASASSAEERLELPSTVAESVASRDPAEQAHRERLAAVSAWRDKVANAEKAFGKATSVMKNLNRNLLARPKETLEEMGELVGQMVAAFLDSPDATLQVMGDKAGGEEVYFHSLNVTILAMMLAKDLGFPAELARDMGVGAMVHDIGLMEIPDRVTKKNPDDYNNAERTLRNGCDSK